MRCNVRRGLAAATRAPAGIFGEGVAYYDAVSERSGMSYPALTLVGACVLPLCTPHLWSRCPHATLTLPTRWLMASPRPCGGRRAGFPLGSDRACLERCFEECRSGGQKLRDVEGLLHHQGCLRLDDYRHLLA